MHPRAQSARHGREAAVLSHELDVDGIRMRWDEYGRGTPVVLVHGIPTSPRLWRKVIPMVGAARVLAWEMVGFGSSIPQAQGRDISVRAQAVYLLQWLDALGIDRAVLAGHDLGGGVLQIAAVHQPHRCAGLLFTNCIGYDSWPIPSVKMLRAGAGVVKHLPDGVLKAGVFGVLMARGHDDPGIADESLAVHFAPYAEHGAGRSLVRQVRALDVDDTLAIADRLWTLREIPARVIWGATDPFQNIHYGQRLAGDLGVPLERIDGGRHFTPEDHPGRIAAALSELVRQASL